MIYEMLVKERLNVNQITKRFNELKIDGWNGWTNNGIWKLAWSATSIGVFVWNRYRREYDFEEDKWVRIENPRKEWVRIYDPSLALIPRECYREARRILAAARFKSKLTGKKRSRNEKSASTLFSGTLFCECGQEIKLIRSKGKYKQMGCLHGVAGLHGCKLSASKSVCQIEKCLLGFLVDSVFTEDRLKNLVVRANERLQEEEAKPKPATSAKRTEIGRKKKRLAKLVLELEEFDDPTICKSLRARISTLEREVIQLQKEVHDADFRPLRGVKPLPIEKAKEYLESLRDLLQQDIPAAAEAIRELTGRIVVRHEPIKGLKRRAQWIARFAPALTARLKKLSGGDAGMRAYWDGAGEVADTIDVVIEQKPVYVQLAPRVGELHKNGNSLKAIAKFLHVSYQVAKAALDYAEGKYKPKWKQGKRTGKGAPQPKKHEIKQEVVRLREEDQLSFAKIAKKLGVCIGTVKAAYDEMRPQAVEIAIEQGKRPVRGEYSHLGGAKKRKIADLLAQGVGPVEVAKQVGCSAAHVYLIRKRQKPKQQ